MADERQELNDLRRLAELEAKAGMATPPIKRAAITPQGAGEAALTMLTGTVAEPLAGLAGIGAAVMPGGESGGGMVNKIRDALTYSPRSESGQAALQGVGNLLSPVTNLLGAAEQKAGDIGSDLAGPMGGAIGASVPTAVGELLGAAGARGVSRIAKAPIPEEVARVIQAGAAEGVPVLTTDVVQPTSFLGRFAQGLSEKMGPLGSGSARATQQAARQEVVQGLADEFDIELDSDFASQMIKSINQKSAETLKKAGEQRKRAIDSLDTFGEVPLNRTKQTIQEQIERQKRLGEKGDAALVANLQKIENSLAGGDFSLVKDIRTEVIYDLKALARSEDPRAEGSLQQVKSAIDEDMIEFAKANDRTAAADWLASNRVFADELINTRQTELRRILNSGNLKPEVILPILKNGKRSELVRLRNALTESGKESAQAAILQDALKESGFFTGNINPDRFATAMNRTGRQQSVDVFFTKADDKRIEGLTRLLDATRRAQQASANPATGVQAVPFLATGGFAAGMASNPFLALATTATMSGIAKAYESAPMRTLLLKIANSKKGSIEEAQLLGMGTPLVLAALQAAKTQSDQTEETR